MAYCKYEIAFTFKSRPNSHVWGFRVICPFFSKMSTTKGYGTPQGKINFMCSFKVNPITTTANTTK